MRDVLRALPVLRGSAPPFDPGRVPDAPLPLFTDWLQTAIDAGVAEPHAMTLSTVDGRGRPDARVLICKDVDETGWHFGTATASRKGADLAANPAAALTFYWRELGRSVRIRGAVVADPEAARVRDFRARTLEARALVLTGRQSSPIAAPGEVEAELEAARRTLQAEPELVPDNWISYAVVADEIEFWQSAPTRLHQRVRYERNGEGGTAWRHLPLWA